jgi:ABC-type branched-subunit amino acid transport system ATPase component
VDTAEGIAFVALIRRGRDELGVSVIMTTRVMPAVASLSERVMLLDHGKRIAEARRGRWSRTGRCHHLRGTVVDEAAS